MVHVYDDGQVINTGGIIDNSPIAPSETRKVFIQLEHFGNGCSSCSIGIYRLSANIIMPDSSQQNITSVLLPNTDLLDIKVCSTGRPVTLNRCP